MLTKELILSKYPKISSLKDIKKLNIWGEDIEDISIISNMSQLEILSLSSNRISSLCSLSNCLNLREIYLRNNNIYSFEELNHLKNLPNLKILWLEGNPICKDIFYIKKVLNILPKLKNLDNKNMYLYKRDKISAKKRGQSEDQKLKKNECDYNANVISNMNKKKFCLRRVFSYFDSSNEGRYIDISNNVSLSQNKDNNKDIIKNTNSSEFKIKFNINGKSERKEKKSFKRIKLRMKNQNINNNLSKNFIVNNYVSNIPKISSNKKTVGADPKPIIRENITVHNSIIHNNFSDLKEQNVLKNNKISFVSNKVLYNNIFGNKNDNRINISNNNNENNIIINSNISNNSYVMKAVYLLIDKMNIKDLISLKEVIDKKINFLMK